MSLTVINHKTTLLAEFGRRLTNIPFQWTLHNGTKRTK